MTRFTSTAGLVAGLMLLPTALAVPNVTVVPLHTGDCSQWPGFLQSGDRIDTTSYLQLAVDQSDDDGIDGLLATEADYHWPGGRDTPQGFNYTAIAFDLRKSRRFARIDFRCFDGVLRLAEFGNGTSATKVTDLPALSVNKDRRNGFIIESNPSAGNLTAWTGYPVEPYTHVDAATGKALPGVFLGARNLTTWGFNFNSDRPCGLPFVYEARLQGLPQDPNTEARATYDPEFFGFLRIVQYR